MEAAQAFVELVDEEAELKARLKEVTEEKAIVGAEVLAFFEQQGVSKITVDGRTLFPKFTRYAGKLDEASTEAVLAALHEYGWEDYAPERVNWQGLSAVFRERDDEGLDPVPEDLRKVLALSSRPEVGHRRA